MSKTISDIIPPSRRKMQDAPERASSEDTWQPPLPPRPVRSQKRRSSGGFPYGTAIIALILIVGSLALLASFASAKVIITPNSTTATISDTLTATLGTGALPFETVTVTKSVSAVVPAESTENVNDPAKGSILISNAQTVPQALIKNTRFVSADGHIFRIHDSVVVPAATAAGPGTVSAIAYADIGGADYNIDPTTFTIPGLKGSKSYTLVTAKSTTAMQGGFSGTRPSVSQATRDAQNKKSQDVLLQSLIADAKTKLGPDYVILAGGTFPTFEPQSDTSAKDGQVNINLQGSLTAVAFPNKALAKALANKIAGSYSGQDVHLEDTSGLTITPTDPTRAPGADQTYSFAIAGNATIIWDIDVKKIAGAVAGKTAASAKQIIISFPEVSEAHLQIQPFWSQTFPADPASIKVSTTSAAASK